MAPPSSSLEIVLFHSALGRRPAVLRWADELRALGCVVHAPDLYDGPVFDDVESGMRHVESMGGIPWLMARTALAVEGLRPDVVYAGFSNGAASAEHAVLSRPGARGAILMHGAMPVEMFGASAWPAGVPAQLHDALRDPYRHQEGNDAFAAQVRAAGAAFESFDYDCDGHLFADDAHPDFDPAAERLMMRRVREFLARVAAA